MFNVIFYGEYFKNQEYKTNSMNTIRASFGQIFNPNSVSGTNSLIESDYNFNDLVDAQGLFIHSNLNVFNNDMNQLINGVQMFWYCQQLENFDSNLTSLTDGSGMFSNCYNLESFTSNLNSLVDGSCMFYQCPKLKQFNINLPSLLNGAGMFSYCNNLESFTSDLSSLINGSGMFMYCTGLESFTSDLSSLITGYQMFAGCKLNPQSIMYIANTIKDLNAEKEKYLSEEIPWVDAYSYPQLQTRNSGWVNETQYFFHLNIQDRNIFCYPEACDGNNVIYFTNTYATYPIDLSFTNFITWQQTTGKISIGINVTDNATSIQQELEDFANEAGFDSWVALNQVFIDKGWDVTWLYGGQKWDSIPYNLRNRQEITPCKIYTKLIEVKVPKLFQKNNNSFAKYRSVDGTKFYNITWGHDVTNTDGYDVFNNLQEACQFYGVVPNENQKLKNN